ncbi:protein of unknown function [Methylacidimicrobium sp. AP8]|nr:protein of unknown function [Methylacidimicrobium sp. AP8]
MGLGARRAQVFHRSCRKTFCEEGKPSGSEADEPVLPAVGERLWEMALKIYRKAGISEYRTFDLE